MENYIHVITSILCVELVNMTQIMGGAFIMIRFQCAPMQDGGVAGRRLMKQ